MATILGYKTTRGARISNTAAARYGPVIAEMADREGGITPEHIVNESQTPGTDLFELDQEFNYFERNNKQAAHQWRIQQARVLVNSISADVLTDSGETVELPLFESVRFVVTSRGGLGVAVGEDDGPDEYKNRYITVRCLASDDVARSQVIDRRIASIRAALSIVEGMQALGAGGEDRALRKIENAMKKYLARLGFAA